jgi:hypothetical protein
VKLIGLIKDTNSWLPAHRFEVHFKWVDMWVGFYWDRLENVLWVCPLPMLAIRIQLGR